LEPPAGEHSRLLDPFLGVLSKDRAPAGWPGELIADGMSCPSVCGVSTESLGR